MNAILKTDAAVPAWRNAAPVTPWKIDAQRGTRSTRVSSEWCSRSDDERFLSLADLDAYVTHQAEHSKAETLGVRDIRVIAEPSAPRKLALEIGARAPVELTAHSFGQVCSMVGAPAGYLRKLPAFLAGVNLQHGIREYSGELMKTYTYDDGADAPIMRAVTSPTYGRILDQKLVRAVRRIAEDGDWKVPGVIDWATSTYNPDAPVTKQSTTLYASDRDVFMFLVDDRHPIEIGKLPSGEPDYLFRGFYAWNSEVGSKTFGIASFYMRGACQNRCIWGIEGFSEFKFNHTRGAPTRFAMQATLKLRELSNQGTARVAAGVAEAKRLTVGTDDDTVLAFLGRQKFSPSQAQTILDTVEREEGCKARSVWDVVQGITAVARSVPNADDRVELERRAGKLLDTVKL